MDSVFYGPNSYDGFAAFAYERGIALHPEQQEIARQLFSMPLANGKSTLVTLLFMYDMAGQDYLNYFSKIRSGGYQMG